MFHRYRDPSAVGGWIGWFEDHAGACTAFVDADRQVVFMDDLA